MDLDKIPLFGMMKSRLGWLNKRQEVLAQNVANADTPGYKPRDLKAFDFKELMKAQPQPFVPKLTHPAHQAGAFRAVSPYASEVNDAPYETAPDGNAVVLEEQMAKINETQLQHRLTTELYRKHIGMIKIALGKSQ